MGSERGLGRALFGAVAMGALLLGTPNMVGCSDTETSGGGTCAPAKSSESWRLQAVGDHFEDELGRRVLLRGVNTGGRSKFPPFFPFPFGESGHPLQGGEPDFESAAKAYLAPLKDWGHNVVRMPFSWEALEPTRGSYDETYLGRYRRFVQLAAEVGLRVVVDFHQDVFARPYCGDGFPLWALEDPSLPIPAVSECKTWYDGYLGGRPPDAAFDRFWANTDGLQDAFIAMWEKMAEALWQEPNVIGFEIINEPHHGSQDAAEFQTKVLAPFYTNLTKVIQAKAPGALVFFDASGSDGASWKTSIPKPEGDGLVFAPHYYHPAVFVFGAETAAYETDTGIGNWAAQGKAYQAPVFVGEFGCRTGSVEAGEFLGAVFDSLDKNWLSGAAWEYSTTKDDWNNEGFGLTGYKGEKTPSADALPRVYVRALAGTPISFTFDSAAKTAELHWQNQAGLVTELAIPKTIYPNGVEVRTTQGTLCAAFNAATGRLNISGAEGEAQIDLRARP